MIAPNVLVDDAVARFARRVALDEPDRTRLEHQLADSSGIALDDLGIDQLVGRRDAALLVVHDRDDREVAFVHAERLAAIWRNAALHPLAQRGAAPDVRTRPPPHPARPRRGRRGRRFRPRWRRRAGLRAGPRSRPPAGPGRRFIVRTSAP